MATNSSSTVFFVTTDELQDIPNSNILTLNRFQFIPWNQPQSAGHGKVLSGVKADQPYQHVVDDFFHPAHGLIRDHIFYFNPTMMNGGVTSLPDPSVLQRGLGVDKILHLGWESPNSSQMDSLASAVDATPVLNQRWRYFVLVNDEDKTGSLGAVVINKLPEAPTPHGAFNFVKQLVSSRSNADDGFSAQYKPAREPLFGQVDVLSVYTRSQQTFDELTKGTASPTKNFNEWLTAAKQNTIPAELPSVQVPNEFFASRPTREEFDDRLKKLGLRDADENRPS